MLINDGEIYFNRRVYMEINKNVSKLIEKFSKLDEVEGILLAGSHA